MEDRGAVWRLHPISHAREFDPPKCRLFISPIFLNKNINVGEFTFSFFAYFFLRTLPCMRVSSSHVLGEKRNFSRHWKWNWAPFFPSFSQGYIWTIFLSSFSWFFFCASGTGLVQIWERGFGGGTGKTL